MGEMGTRTVETQDAMEKADYLFGAKRLLAGLHAKEETLPYYLAEDIIPVLSDALDQAAGETVRAVILFSGDGGFYSGCEKLYQKLTAWKKERHGRNLHPHTARDLVGVLFCGCLRHELAGRSRY